ncbi:MAG: hypothetical protein ACD_58C00131G0004 [uncultured bacterium]|nr:MAG: hypothetical protein ACD_58C00131G0004 [uncultured bacterium]
MNELTPAPSERKNMDETKKPNFGSLNFQELKSALLEINQLASKTFTRLDNGFVNANGDGIYFKKYEKDKFKVYDCDNKLQSLFLTHNNEIMFNYFPDKNSIVKEIEELFEKLGMRIIE